MTEDGSAIRIERCSRPTLMEWVALRHVLWPQGSFDEHRQEAEELLSEPAQAAAFLAFIDSKAIGFAEAALRHDYVNGCASSPVGFLEGIYVDPAYRRQSAARLLCRAVEEWAAGLGCLEFASDVELHNTASQHMHEALGFEETERVIYYRKRLPTGL
jgi:aminoglycoside 6'-N-acetyltransferase I